MDVGKQVQGDSEEAGLKTKQHFKQISCHSKEEMKMKRHEVTAYLSIVVFSVRRP